MKCDREKDCGLVAFLVNRGETFTSGMCGKNPAFCGRRLASDPNNAEGGSVMRFRELHGTLLERQGVRENPVAYVGILTHEEAVRAS